MPYRSRFVALSANVASVPYTQLVLSWERSLKAANLSDQTIYHYLTSAWALGAFLSRMGMPQEVEHLTREHVEAFLSDLRDLGRKSNTLLGRYAGLRQFFRWLLEEGEITASPMEHMRPPKLDDTDPPIMTAEMVQKLLKACAGTDFEARRDSAMVRVLIDTGMRAGALAGILLADVSLDEQTVLIHSKGRKTRTVPYGVKAAAALDRYLRIRPRHLRADDAHLWIAKFGGLTYGGIHGILNRRAQAAGIGHIHQHMFRHGFADMWLASGGQESDLMSIGGWEDASVMRRYGRLRKDARAREAHKRLSPGDRL
jgi:site-specific recombinase XerD